MNSLDIKVDIKNNSISIKNNGKGIPIVVHGERTIF